MDNDERAARRLMAKAAAQTTIASRRAAVGKKRPKGTFGGWGYIGLQTRLERSARKRVAGISASEFRKLFGKDPL